MMEMEGCECLAHILSVSGCGAARVCPADYMNNVSGGQLCREHIHKYVSFPLQCTLELEHYTRAI